MKESSTKFFVLLATFVVISFSFRQSDDSFANDYVVFAGASTDFHIMDSVAKVISSKTNIEYRNDLEYDRGRGMIVPDTSSDEIYRGTYYPRRYTGERISVEMVWYYKSGSLADDDSSKTMCILTGIFSNRKDAAANLKKVKAIVPDAYMKKVRLYQGCMH
ncbi:MAG TPA: hypothetical protein VL651_13510 [Bacteroidia bacterium]|jgi:hypothetical protein|nr:hypothetical protein [Bacteroidia bacterium]